jgi:very-short-patch-repair endonuclease
MREERGERRAKLARLAGRQHGVVSYSQLRRLGFDRGAIDRLVTAGFLHRLFRGVYAVGHPNVTRDGRFMAAVLTCGSEAVLNCWAATAHWELLGWRDGAVIDVAVVGHRRGQRGIRTHRVAQVERTLRRGIPITTVPRTLLDLAAVATEKQLRRATNEAERKGLLTERAVRDLVERHKGRKGMKAFVAVTAAVNAGTHRTRSDLEADFLEFCRTHRIRKPVSNGEVEGYEVDMHWPGTTLIVELDDYRYHGTPTSFEQDRRRDADLKLKGYTVIRVTGAWMDTDPAGLARTIRQLLRRT